MAMKFGAGIIRWGRGKLNIDFIFLKLIYMFDDQNPKSAPPNNLPSEPDDMFADVDKISTAPSAPSAPNALQAGVLKPKIANTLSPDSSGAPSVVTTPAMYAVKEPIVGKIILIVVLLAVLGGAGYYGYRLYKNGFFSAKDAVAPEPPINNVVAPPVTPPVASAPVVPETPPVSTPPVANVAIDTTTAQAGVNMASDEILFGEGVDSDKDGLDDVRENEIGTGIYQVDTDNDGLSDGDEVIIWKSDPLNPDTDKDTYQDGQEVKFGYNPLGPGKLFNVPTTTVK